MNEHDWEKMLESVQPQADPAFRQQLEDRLLARMEQQRKVKKMNSNGYLLHAPAKPAFALKIPLTLAATIGVVLLIGGLWAATQYDNSFFGSGVQATLPATLTPTIPPTSLPTATPFPATQPPMEGSLSHVVQAGDTCVSILMQYGYQDLAALETFYALNNMRDCTLEPGMTVLIPPSPVELLPTVIPDQFTATPLPMVEPVEMINVTPTMIAPLPMGDYCRSVVVATRDLPRGTFLSADMLNVVCWVGDTPPDAVTAIADAERFFLRSDVWQWTPILPDQLVSGDAVFQSEPEAFGTPLEAGTVAITLPLDREVFYPWREGDQLQITVRLTIYQGEENCDSLENCTDIRPEDLKEITAPIEAKVVDLHWVPLNSDQRGQGFVTVAVSEQDAVILTWAQEAEIPLVMELIAPQ